MLCAYDGKTGSRVVFKLSPFIVDMDVHVQYVASSVIHNLDSWGGSHDLLQVFNTSLVIDDLAPPIWSEHDHRAVAAGLCAQTELRVFVSVTSKLTFTVVSVLLVKGTLRMTP